MSTDMASTLQQAFGEKMAARRRELELTQTDLAKKLDMRQSTVSDIERGAHAPTLGTVEKIAKALKTTAAKLIS